MGPSTSRRALLRAFVCASFVLATVALPDDSRFYRRADLYARADTPSSTSESTSASGSASASVTGSSSSVFSSSTSSRSTTSISASSTFSRSVSSSTSTPTSSSTTSVTSTTTSSSRSVSFSSLPSSSATTASASKSSAVLFVPPTKPSGPASALDVPPQLPTPTDSDSNEPTDTSIANSNVNAASTGFWGNKGAVGGTFTAVALLVIGILVALSFVIRRRAANTNSARDTFFDTKGPPDRIERHSAAPSMVSLGNEPMDAHATAGPNYGAADHYLVDAGEYNQTGYNVSYPPGAAYADAAYAPADHTTPATQQYHATTADQHYPDQNQHYTDGQYYADGTAYDSYDQYYAQPAADAHNATGDNGYSVTPANHRPSLSPHPYSHPSHAPPSALRDFVGRDSYQPSIDSFYGASGKAV